MNARFKQETRMGSLTTVLGADTLSLLRMVADEQMNGLFVIRLEALSENDDLDFDALVGTHATVKLKSFENPDVYYDGIVTDAAFAGMQENGWKYELTLRPWFWLSGRRRNQRIYHEKTVVEILDEVLAPYSALSKPAVNKKLGENYPTLEYTVQYRESDLAFATRLMERFGISYHFEHTDGNHTLVMTDAITAHAALPGATRKFMRTSEGHRADEEHFWDVRPQRRITTGGIRLTDYNFKAPNAAMEVDRMGDAAYAEGQIESYDYPGDYLEAGRGKDVARLRTLQERGQDHRHRAVGDCTSLRAGQIVKINGDKIKGVTDPCLCLTARHTYTSDSYASGQSNDGPVYEGSYTLLPTSAPLAPERKTDIPTVQGPQTAVVVGEGEIDCDEYGRILVRFHWDLDKRNSMRCRVSQNWAGKGWGGMVIPRIGMEVVVEFLEGDPDKPLVTGCVYNGKNDVPYELPKHKTRSTFKTDTHQGIGYNELRFEDEKGKEDIHLHAQHDHSVKVLNHQTNRVDSTKIESVGRASLREVRLIDVHNIGMDMTINVGTGTQGGFVRKPLTDNPQGIRLAAYNFEQSFPDITGRGNYTLTATSGIALSAGTSWQTNVGGEATLNYGANLSQSVQSNVRETAGKNHSQVVGAKYKLDAHDGIHLRCGAAELIMKPDGTILINGKDMTTKMSGNLSETATGDISQTASGSMALKASKIDLN